MAGNEARIKFLIQDNVTKGVKNIERSITDLEKNIKNTSNKSQGSFLKMGDVANTALGFTAAGAITKVVDGLKQFAIESVKAGLKFEQQFQSLRLQTGKTADEIEEDLGQMRNATKGLVSDLTLLQVKNKALALGLRSDDLPGLLEVAAARAKILGVSTESAANDIVTGIGRASPLILDNLGIVIDSEIVYGEYADSIGKSAEELTKQERAVALSTSTIENSAHIVEAFSLIQETANEKIERGSASWQNFKADVGGVVTAFVSFISTQADAETAITSTNAAFQTGQDELIKLQAGFVETEQSVKSLSDNINNLSNELQGLVGVQSQEEVEAQREINRLQLEKITAQRTLNELAGAEKALRDGGSVTAEDIVRLNEAKQIVTDTNTQLQEQKLFLDEARLTKQVDVDTAISQGEDEGIIREAELKTVADIGSKIQDIVAGTKEDIKEREVLLTSLDTQAERMSAIKKDQEAIVVSLDEEIEKRRTLAKVFEFGEKGAFGFISDNFGGGDGGDAFEDS